MIGVDVDALIVDSNSNFTLSVTNNRAQTCKFELRTMRGIFINCIVCQSMSELSSSRHVFEILIFFPRQKGSKFNGQLQFCAAIGFTDFARRQRNVHTGF